LDKLNSAENADFKAGGSGYPYVNLAGRYRVTTQYDPHVLRGLTMEQIAAALADPTSRVAKSVDGAANLITAGLCSVTHNQPANVCADAPITSLESRLGGGA